MSRLEKDQGAAEKHNGDSKLTVTVACPYQTKPFSITIPAHGQLSLINQYLLDLGQEQQPLTCFYIAREDFPERELDLLATASECGIDTGTKLVVVPKEYSRTDILNHLKQAREQLGFKSKSVRALNEGATCITLFKNTKIFQSDKKSSETATEPLEPSKTTKLSNNGDNEINSGQSKDDTHEQEAPVIPTILSKDHPIFEKSKPVPAHAPQNESHLVQELSLSAWNPVRPQYVAQGHKAYLRLVTLSGKIFHITAHSKGFSVNSSSDVAFDPKPLGIDDVSVLRLACKLCDTVGKPISETLVEKRLREENEDSVRVLASSSTSACFLSSPWLVGELPPIKADMYLTQVSSQSSGRDWMEEFCGALELERDSIQDMIARDRLLASTVHEFAIESAEGVQDILEGGLPPLNPEESEGKRVYLRGGIFYTMASDAVGLYTKLGGDEAARVAAKRDLLEIERLIRLDLDVPIIPVLTAVIDFLGRRVVAQCVVPGIFRESSSPKVIYGREPGSEQDGTLGQLRFDPTVHKHLERIGERLHVKPHTVWDEDGRKEQLATCMEAKVMIGTDGRSYLLDLCRLLPPDLAFLHQKSEVAYPHQMALLRPEAVSAWAQKHGPLNPDVTFEEAEVPECLRSEILSDRQKVLAASKYVQEIIIPKFVNDVQQDLLPYPIDSTQLVHSLHELGVSVRHLGFVHSVAKTRHQEAMNCSINNKAESSSQRSLSCLIELIEVTAVARAIKNIIRKKVSRVAPSEAYQVVARYFCSLRDMSESDLNSLSTEIASRYRVFIDNLEDTVALPAVFRQASSMLGLQWNNMFSPTPSNLLAIVPRVYVPQVFSKISSEAMSAGKESVNKGEKEGGMEFIYQALSFYSQVYGPVHQEVGRAFNQAAILSYDQHDYATASQLARNAIVILERTLGVDSYEVVVLYLNLIIFERLQGNLNEALVFSRHVLNLWNQVAPRTHPELATTFANVGRILQHLHCFEQSISWLERAKDLTEVSFGSGTPEVARILFQLSQSLLMVDDLRGATRIMEQAYRIFKSTMGPENDNTIESKKYLDQLLTTTVRSLKQSERSKRLSQLRAEPRIINFNAVAPRIGEQSANEVLKYIMGDD